MLHAFTQLRPDRTRVAVVAIRGYPVRDNIGDGLGGWKNALAAAMSQCSLNIHVDQRTVAVNGAIEIAPMPVHLDVRLVNVPTFPNLAASATAQTFSQCSRELRVPVADGLMTEHDAAYQEHLRKVAQAEFVAQPPEHHGRDDVRRILRPVQQVLAALVELFATGATAIGGNLERYARSVPRRPSSRTQCTASMPLLADGPPYQARFDLTGAAGARSGGTGVGGCSLRNLSHFASTWATAGYGVIESQRSEARAS